MCGTIKARAHVKGRISAEGVRDYGAEKGVWAKEGGNNCMMNSRICTPHQILRGLSDRGGLDRLCV